MQGGGTVAKGEGLQQTCFEVELVQKGAIPPSGLTVGRGENLPEIALFGRTALLHIHNQKRFVGAPAERSFGYGLK